MSEVLPLEKTVALVIDGSAATRHDLSRQLRDFGAARVDPARGLIEGRQRLANGRYDVVLCSDMLDGTGANGQQLLEELRRDALLPHTTVFVMLAGEATYSAVTEAAELALDSFLLRPFRANDLLNRIQAARHRRRVLAALFEALNRNDAGSAVAACLKHHAEGGEFATMCLRTAAELLLRHQRSAEAHRLFQSQVDRDGALWARLGVARCALALGELELAQAQLTALVEGGANSPDLHDVLGRLAVENGEFELALAECKRAAEMTAHCMLRLQACASMAFYMGDPALSLGMLARARMIDTQSRLFDGMTWMMQALLSHDSDAAKGVVDARAGLGELLLRYPKSPRLQRMVAATEVLMALQQQRTDTALTQLDALADQRREPGFDVEASVLVLALWVRIPQQEFGAARQEHVIGELGLRCGASLAARAAMRGVARRCEPVLNLLDKAFAQIDALAQQHRSAILAGPAAPALADLVNDATRTLNARLVNLGLHLLERPLDGLPPDEQSAARLAFTTLRDTWCRPITVVAGARRTNRSIGGMAVRISTAPTSHDMAPALAACDRA